MQLLLYSLFCRRNWGGAGRGGGPGPWCVRAVGVGAGLRCGGGRDGQFTLAVLAGSCGLLGHLCFIAAALARLLSGCCRGLCLGARRCRQWRVQSTWVGCAQLAAVRLRGFGEPNAGKVAVGRGWAGLAVLGPRLPSLFLEMAHLSLLELNPMLL